MSELWRYWRRDARACEAQHPPHPDKKTLPDASNQTSIHHRRWRCPPSNDRKCVDLFLPRSFQIMVRLFKYQSPNERPKMPPEALRRSVPASRPVPRRRRGRYLVPRFDHRLTRHRSMASCENIAGIVYTSCHCTGLRNTCSFWAADLTSRKPGDGKRSRLGDDKTMPTRLTPPMTRRHATGGNAENPRAC